MGKNAYQIAEERYANIETTLNRWGYFPIASTFSGFLRGAIGTVQTFIGNIGLGLKGCQYFLHKRSEA